MQLGIFWIATAWLAAGLFIGPLVSGASRSGQRLGVNVLFVALLVVVVGSLAGQWLSVQQQLLGRRAWFYFGHQGLRVRRPGPGLADRACFVGLFLWLVLVVRAMLPGAAASRASSGTLLRAVPDRRDRHRRCSTAPASTWGRHTQPRDRRSTGAGGWSTCGSKASSRSSPPWSSPSSSRG